MAQVRVSLGPPVHGWMALGLIAGEGEVEFELSDVPGDSLRELVEQLRAILDGLSRTVCFFLEPAEMELQLEPLPEGRTRLTVTQWPSEMRTAGQVVLVWEGEVRELALGFWRALRRLHADHFEGGTSADWSWPFPVRQVELLGRSLER